LPALQSFHGVRFDGRTYDCGSRLGFLTANIIAFALDRSDIALAQNASCVTAVTDKLAGLG
jgi:UTP--glucose-1-phosphate uridylyltransferase